MVVTTFTEMETGEIVTEIPVTGSVHDEEEAELAVVEVVVVQVTAVLAGAAPQEDKLTAARIKRNRERRFTAQLFSAAWASAAWAWIPAILGSCGSLSTRFSKTRN